jgi:hypothetical protein
MKQQKSSSSMIKAAEFTESVYKNHISSKLTRYMGVANTMPS